MGNLCGSSEEKHHEPKDTRLRTDESNSNKVVVEPSKNINDSSSISGAQKIVSATVVVVEPASSSSTGAQQNDPDHAENETKSISFSNNENEQLHQILITNQHPFSSAQSPSSTRNNEAPSQKQEEQQQEQAPQTPAIIGCALVAGDRANDQ